MKNKKVGSKKVTNHLLLWLGLISFSAITVTLTTRTPRTQVNASVSGVNYCASTPSVYHRCGGTTVAGHLLSGDPTYRNHLLSHFYQYPTWTPENDWKLTYIKELGYAPLDTIVYQYLKPYNDTHTPKIALWGGPLYYAGNDDPHWSTYSQLRDWSLQQLERYRLVPNVPIPNWTVINEGYDEYGNRIGKFEYGQLFKDIRSVYHSAKLYYVGILMKPGEQNAVLNLLDSSNGQYINGIGIEAHLVVPIDPNTAPHDYVAQYRNFIQQLVNRGKWWRFHEIDVRIYTADGITDWELAEQRKIYQQLVNLCYNSNFTDKCSGVASWGWTNKYSWIPYYAPGWDSALCHSEKYLHQPCWNVWPTWNPNP